jgi:hypothetical protein
MSRNKKVKNSRSDDGDAFIPESAMKHGTSVDLAQRLAEDHQRSVTSGEDAEEELQDMFYTEEIGGPFLVSKAADEFGDSVSSMEEQRDAERNPFPQAVGTMAIRSADEEREAVEAHEEQTGDIDLPDPADEHPSSLEPDMNKLVKNHRRA